MSICLFFLFRCLSIVLLLWTDCLSFYNSNSVVRVKNQMQNQFSDWKIYIWLLTLNLSGRIRFVSRIQSKKKKFIFLIRIQHFLEVRIRILLISWGRICKFTYCVKAVSDSLLLRVIVDRSRYTYCLLQGPRGEITADFQFKFFIYLFPLKAVHRFYMRVDRGIRYIIFSVLYFIILLRYVLGFGSNRDTIKSNWVAPPPCKIREQAF